jgi:hypothetical protein
MIVQPAFFEHWKTMLLMDRLGDRSAPLYVIYLWAYCQTQKTAKLPHLTPVSLKIICRFTGDEKLLWDSLLECAFIEEKKGFIIVHDWEEWNRGLLNSWSNGGKGGRPQKPVGSMRVNPEAVPGEPASSKTKTKTKTSSPEEEGSGERTPPLPAVKSTGIPTHEEWTAGWARLHPEVPELEVERSWCHYESNGWKVGPNPVKKWIGCIGTWYGTWKERKGSGEFRYTAVKSLPPINPKFSLEAAAARTLKAMEEKEANEQNPAG